MSILDRDYFRDEEKAFSKLESVLWPNGPVCPHCGVVNEAHKIAANPKKKVRYGLSRCNACKEQFTVTVGTVFESSHIPLHKWLQAAYLLCSSKKGVSAKQIERTLEITYKSAWFMMHRLREAMAPAKPGPLGGEGKVIEADETARSFHVDRVNKRTIRKILFDHADKRSELMTDEHTVYPATGAHFVAHYTVNHSQDEYVCDRAYTHTVEGFFSIFKRGMTGIYQHCSEKHLHRYLTEFDFRYSERKALGISDSARTDRALIGAKGKRLTYRGSNASY